MHQRLVDNTVRVLTVQQINVVWLTERRLGVRVCAPKVKLPMPQSESKTLTGFAVGTRSS